jgi:hypothetical protein
MSWVRLSLPCLEFIDLVPPCIDEDALNALRSPDPDQDTKGTENEDIKHIPLFSVKVEIINVKTENDDSQHHIASASDSRTFTLSESPAGDGSSLNTYRVAFNSPRQHEQTPPSACPLIRDPRGRPNASASSLRSLTALPCRARKAKYRDALGGNEPVVSRKVRSWVQSS